MAKRTTSGITPTPASGITLTPADDLPLAPPEYLTRGTQGLENMRPQDVVFPRVKLLQGLSPEVQDPDSGLHPGDLINSVTLERIAQAQEPRHFVPLLFWPEWIEWAPRESGGGIINMSRDPQGNLAKRVGEKKDTGVGGRVVFAVTEYLVFLSAILTEAEGAVRQEDILCLSCCRSNYKHGKRLLNLARLRGPYPLYAGLYRVTTEEDTNARANAKYWALHFSNAGWAPKAVFQAAEKVYQSVKDVRVAASAPTTDDAAGEAEAEL